MKDAQREIKASKIKMIHRVSLAERRLINSALIALQNNLV